MKKVTLLHALIDELENDLRFLQAANQDASAGATHAESRAETKWDTCGLESSYLARGHAEKFKTLAANVVHLRSMALPIYIDKPIGPGALIEVEQNGAVMLFFLLPYGGGVELSVDGQDVTVITPESPVGAALLEKEQGDTYTFNKGITGKVIDVS